MFVLSLHFRIYETRQAIPLNAAGTAFGETFYCARVGASELRAEILTNFFRQKITFLEARDARTQACVTKWRA